MKTLTIDELGDMLFSELIVAASINHFKVFGDRMTIRGGMCPADYNTYINGIHLMDATSRMDRYTEWRVTTKPTLTLKCRQHWRYYTISDFVCWCILWLPTY